MTDRFTSYDIDVKDFMLKVKLEMFLNARVNKDIDMMKFINEICTEMQEGGGVTDSDAITLYKDGRKLVEVNCMVKKRGESKEADEAMDKMQKSAINVDDLRTLMDSEEAFKNDKFSNN